MKYAFNLLCAAAIAFGLAGCIAAPIEMTAQTETRLDAQAPVRFLLTFDDGPSASSLWNPSATVLDSLKDNPVQPDIKAVFFVQTRAPAPATVRLGAASCDANTPKGTSSDSTPPPIGTPTIARLIRKSWSSR